MVAWRKLLYPKKAHHTCWTVRPCLAACTHTGEAARHTPACIYPNGGLPLRHPDRGPTERSRHLSPPLWRWSPLTWCRGGEGQQRGQPGQEEQGFPQHGARPAHCGSAAPPLLEERPRGRGGGWGGGRATGWGHPETHSRIFTGSGNSPLSPFAALQKRSLGAALRGGWLGPSEMGEGTHPAGAVQGSCSQLSLGFGISSFCARPVSLKAGIGVQGDCSWIFYDSMTVFPNRAHLGRHLL